MPFDDTRGLPKNLQRPRSKHKWIDLMLDAAFSFTGPAQVSAEDEGPQRVGRTEEEARSGYGQWERITVGGHSYLVERKAPGADA
ncbi:hypothetical protein [Kineococcus indalonis]|uniref:hypothetical protein n=1 Tax=Kineococcus indalonis TaxID=2696566 RepID=UPI0014131276|nr:hypothetical protein [Kineococcus indalonis]NAZ87188.1 hypothetical protein [Kineococcus indalonis]